MTIIPVDFDYALWQDSLFDWYVADQVEKRNNNESESSDDHIEWTHVHHGHFCIFTDEHVHKFVRLVCLPRNNSLREGTPIEQISKNRIIQCPNDLPMSNRHQLTPEYFPANSTK